MKMLRFAMGVTRKDKIRNGHIRSTVKVERLGMKMREGRLRWYGDVMRRDQKYAGRKMMEMELPGKRRRGRPKKKFVDVVKEDMGEVGAKETDVEGLENDETLWPPLTEGKGRKKTKKKNMLIIMTLLHLYNVLLAYPTRYIVFTASFLFSFYCVFVVWFVLLQLRNKKHTYIHT